MKSSFNTYISAKRVKQFTDKRQQIGAGELPNGIGWAAGIDPDRPALLIQTVTTDRESLRLRLDFQRLVQSLIGAEVADADRWEPLYPASQDGYWGNSMVTVHVQHHANHAQISYHRHDRAPIHDWRIGQRIKNEVLGPEWEAIEIYPAESRLVDTSNEYHLFAINGPLPFGFDYRDVNTQDQIDRTDVAAIQRDPDPDVETNDIDSSTHKPVRAPRPAKTRVYDKHGEPHDEDRDEAAALISEVRAYFVGRRKDGAMTCQHCGNTIESDPKPVTLGGSPTKWTHNSPEWLGRRCPDGSRYAEPAGTGI
jgi:hypothetical protein